MSLCPWLKVLDENHQGKRQREKAHVGARGLDDCRKKLAHGGAKRLGGPKKKCQGERRMVMLEILDEKSSKQ